MAAPTAAAPAVTLIAYTGLRGAIGQLCDEVSSSVEGARPPETGARKARRSHLGDAWRTGGSPPASLPACGLSSRRSMSRAALRPLRALPGPGLEGGRQSRAAVGCALLLVWACLMGVQH